MSKALLSVEEVIPQDFFIKNGLYESFQYSKESRNKAMSIVHYTGPLDCYCTECSQNSIFSAERQHMMFAPLRANSMASPDIVDIGLTSCIAHDKKFICSRSSNHILLFTLLLNNGVLSKIGQFPSYADINSQGVDLYKTLLPNDLYIEFKIGVGLFAHGVGAGSLIYLRRIIEKFMIHSAYEKARGAVPNWDDKAYERLRVGEKIKLLTAYLPEYLVKNPVVYSIVSKGIHELSEKECVQYFPVLRDFIELVLTDMKSARDVEARKAQLATDMQKIAGKI